MDLLPSDAGMPRDADRSLGEAAVPPEATANGCHDRISTAPVDASASGRPLTTCVLGTTPPTVIRVWLRPTDTFPDDVDRMARQMAAAPVNGNTDVEIANTPRGWPSP